MTIQWDSYRQLWHVMEDEVELCQFRSLHAAEQWVIGESKRREAQT